LPLGKNEGKRKELEAERNREYNEYLKVAIVCTACPLIACCQTYMLRGLVWAVVMFLENPVLLQ